MYYTELSCTSALYCIALHSIVWHLKDPALNCAASNCSLQCTLPCLPSEASLSVPLGWPSTALYNSALYTILHYTTVHCTTLQYPTLYNATLHCPFNNSTFPSAQHSTTQPAVHTAAATLPDKSCTHSKLNPFKTVSIFLQSILHQKFHQWFKSCNHFHSGQRTFQIPQGIKISLSAISEYLAWRRRKIVGGKADWIN